MNSDGRKNDPVDWDAARQQRAAQEGFNEYEATHEDADGVCTRDGRRVRVGGTRHHTRLWGEGETKGKETTATVTYGQILACGCRYEHEMKLKELGSGLIVDEKCFRRCACSRTIDPGDEVWIETLYYHCSPCGRDVLEEFIWRARLGELEVAPIQLARHRVLLREIKRQERRVAWQSLKRWISTLFGRKEKSLVR